MKNSSRVLNQCPSWILAILLLTGAGILKPFAAEETIALPNDPFFAPYRLIAPPAANGLQLQKGDRLSICGDSITEQKMYSRILETYLTVCAPQWDISCRQFGWSGEQAGGFRNRLDQDVLRFHPTIATTCYGMNDHRYVPYTDEIGKTYRDHQTAIVRALKEAGCRVVLGSPGTIDSVPPWVKSAQGTKQDLNLSLCRLRNIALEVSLEEKVAFADVYLPMLVQGWEAKKKYGEDFMVSGKDGVHPGWAGQVIMAYAFLKTLGLEGEIGTLTIDDAKASATASEGHEVLNFANNRLAIRSHRYPFCAGSGDPAKDDNLRAGFALVPFDDTLNRFMLRIQSPKSAQYRVTWGETSRVYASADLSRGINLAKDFVTNPFTPAFDRVWQAVFAKQEYETRQIKQLFHGPEGAVDIEATASLTEKARGRLVRKVRESFRPVEHELRIEPVA
ncbi:MAG TPA: SGNH/GDSL hydrolase family protein [Candidatus Paceibacterota bacterium]|nr:SGNH/GDSL hydrolase family protein [Verrucomicrobiota bacterium]HRY49200.1 SGNH/GDSL hydrolase family protein [Candidatus Paceibacterota bacterium]